MKVFIISNDLDLYHWDILEVFLSEEKAKEKLNNLISELDEHEENFKLEEFEVTE